ncbi:MAG: hypothetical protein ABSB94_05050 [Syntrophorhabdales bacterium]|jgi:hypothetical protein
MTIAEIHGKLVPYESREDLLTSDVFGTFKYCDPTDGLIPFLGRAISFSSQKAPVLSRATKSAKYFFWPKSTTGLEPDLIIILTEDNGRKIACNIEAKYLSGKHNRDDDSPNAEQPDRIPGDQLYAQYKVLKDKAYKDELQRELQGVEQNYLFYVTAHYVPPCVDIKETMRCAKEKGDEEAVENFFWLNWAKADSVCRAGVDEGTISTSALLFEDLSRLLRRKRLREFGLWQDREHNSKIERVATYFWKGQMFWKHLELAVMQSTGPYFWKA